MLALKFESSDWEIHNNIGTIKREMGEFDEAAAYFKKAMEINPDCPGIYLKLGRTYILSKEYSRANIVLENAIGRSTENISINTENELPELLFVNSEALFCQEEYDKAIDELLMYIEMDKDNADAYNRLGLCLYRTGNYKEAAGCFSNASEINNKNPNYYANLGNALRKDNIYNDAKLAYECALLLDKDNAIAKMGLEAMAINRSLEK